MARFIPPFFTPSSPEVGPPDPERLIRWLSASMLGIVGILLLSLVTLQTGAIGSQDVPAIRGSAPSANSAPSSSDRSSARSLKDLSIHPSNMLAPYLRPSAPASTANHPSVLEGFHDLLRQYVHQQTEDGNFTIRVIDRRDNQVLERFELTDLRRAYEQGRAFDWEEVDEHRREAMERLVDKYERRGVPLEDIIVRWGRAHQVDAAHERDRAYQAYERRLARYLGLSLLATEIGTVETFNQDHLVSAAGAQSRYQMMPWILRRNGVNEYTLPTDGEAWIRVEEELHPLLVLEPAFLLLRGYVNAVGHEIPGLSAYHTGPGNIYKLYRQFYTSSTLLTTTSTVTDAYAWAVTDGYDTVSEGSTFGSDSRGYVPALYGSLVARDDRSVAPSPPLRAARVQIRPDTTVVLRDVLAPLDSAAQSFDWGPTAPTGESIYERFRALNPHFDLPPASDNAIPAAGNVHLLPAIDGKAVRFFLPIKAPSFLRAAGIHVLDSTATFRFDASTYTPPPPSQITRWDRQYRRLVDDIEHFGFTRRNRERLLRLHDRFETLAEQRPTRFRRRQLTIIRTHRRLWLSNPWGKLADATKKATGRMPVRAQPPAALDTVDFGPQDLSLQNFPLPAPH